MPLTKRTYLIILITISINAHHQRYVKNKDSDFSEALCYPLPIVKTESETRIYLRAAITLIIFSVKDMV